MTYIPEFSEVRGQPEAIDACVRAVVAHLARGTGGLLLSGPPGVGKTMIARRIPTIFPMLTEHESRWLTAEYVGLGLKERYTRDFGTIRDPITERPFRAPHHTISAAALSGAGAITWRGECSMCVKVAARGGVSDPYHQFHTLPTCPTGHPGELQLARFGVLYLDELPEFPKASIEALADALKRMSPATRPLIIACTNPCPCGWLESGVRECTCPGSARVRYVTRTETYAEALGLDDEAPVRMLPVAEMRTFTPGPSSADLRARVVLAVGGAA